MTSFRASAPTAIFCLLCILVHAQGRATLEYFDTDWMACSEKNASYLVEKKKLSDTAWQFRYYNMWGPCIRLETYKDAAKTTRHGKYITYNRSGKRDTAGYFIDNSFHLQRGLADLVTIPVLPGTMPRPANASAVATEPAVIHTDSVSVFTRVEADAQFPGGLNGWKQYISENLRFPKRAEKRSIGGNVVIVFIVDKTGKVSACEVDRSIEYSLDNEGIRLISQSPNWQPATQNGKAVNALKTQPLIFGL